jgi:DNA ligase-4
LHERSFLDGFSSRIIAHGGKSWNVVKDLENLLVVYGGTTKCQYPLPSPASLSDRFISLASVPEINRIIQKGTYDIIRPQWILDCIQLDKPVPLSKKCRSGFCPQLYSTLIATFRYFFHATPHRTETEEYNLEDEDEEADAPMADADDVGFKVPDVPEDKDKEPEGAEQPDIGSALADWFKVEQDETPSVRIHENSDTETEDDSDHDDLPPDEGDDESPDVASGSDFEKVREVSN